MSARRGPTPARRWKPMTPGTPTVRADVDDEQRAANAALRARIGEEAAPEVWGNDRYSCTVKRDAVGDVRWLSIHRRDRKPIRDWRDLQRIKNDIAGPEAEAVELFPAESRLVDLANEYHLWAFPPGMVLPVGWAEGRVVGSAEEAARVGAVQRDLDETSEAPMA